jgi:SAM-dependent methyltransferase
VQNLIEKYIPHDHSSQVQVEYYLERVLKIKSIKEKFTVLDLGCGGGKSLGYFSNINNNADWYGIDIENSPEVKGRKENDKRFITFNGIDIPFPDDYFDFIYCRQVLEHVRYPKELLAEVERVLKPGGYFIGSTSHLEPYHSFSYWNYTPYGFSVLIEEANLNLLELRPSIDSLTLIIRRGLRGLSLFNIFWKIESPLNLFISIFSKIFRVSAYNTNAIKLLFCGQFIFFITKNK